MVAHGADELPQRVPSKFLARSVVGRPGLGTLSLTLLFCIQGIQRQLLLAQLAAGDLLIFGQLTISWAWVPLPTSLPSSSTRIWFACSTVEMRCTTMI